MKNSKKRNRQNLKADYGVDVLKSISPPQSKSNKN